MSKWQTEKQTVLDAGREMLRKGLVVGTSGNVSMRLAPEGDRQLLAITPSSKYYDSMAVDDIQVVDFEGEPVEGDLVPSVETMLHIGIYQSRKNVGAVVHAHPVFASAVAVAGMEIPAILDDQVIFLGGEIECAVHALPGSEELVQNVVMSLGSKNGVLLANHGAVAVGREMREAFTACELLEKTAHVYILSLSLGKPNLVPPEALEAEKAFFAMTQHSDTMIGKGISG